MAHDREPLVPREMQVRRNVRLTLNVTASMFRAMREWMDRMGYEYKIETEDVERGRAEVHL